MGEMILEIDFVMQVLSGLIIVAIAGAASSMFILYKCVHRQAHTTRQMKRAIVVILKLQVEDTRKHHPDSKHIAELDEIFKELMQD